MKLDNLNLIDTDFLKLYDEELNNEFDFKNDFDETLEVLANEFNSELESEAVLLPNYYSRIEKKGKELFLLYNEIEEKIYLNSENLTNKKLYELTKDYLFKIDKLHIFSKIGCIHVFRDYDDDLDCSFFDEFDKDLDEINSLDQVKFKEFLFEFLEDDINDFSDRELEFLQKINKMILDKQTPSSDSLQIRNAIIYNILLYNDSFKYDLFTYFLGCKEEDKYFNIENFEHHFYYNEDGSNIADCLEYEINQIYLTFKEFLNKKNKSELN